MQDITAFIQNHWLLSTSVLIILLLLVLVEFIKQKQGATQLSPSKVIHLINRENATVIDIRDAEAYAAGHIVESISIPASELKNKLKKLDKLKSTPIVLVCTAGIEAPKAAIALQKEGFDVHILAGGIRAWKAADLPLVKS